MIENLFTTRIGSHAWGMNHPGSDIDLFRVGVASTKDLLTGTADIRSRHKQFVSQSEIEIDCHIHEVGTLIFQLLKGNVNFVIGVMSPCVEECEDIVSLLSLKQITEENVGKSIYPSIKGMANRNYTKYISSGKDASTKKCNTILRMIKFGITYLETGKFKFEKVEGCTHSTIIEGIKNLDEAYLYSELLSVPIEKPFRDWLYGVRLSEWEEK